MCPQKQTVESDPNPRNFNANYGDIPKTCDTPQQQEKNLISLPEKSLKYLFQVYRIKFP